MIITDILKKIEFLKKRKAHWDTIYKERDSEAWLGGNYRRMLARVYRYLLGDGSSVLEIGCGRGDLLASIEPLRGVGVDFSSMAIEQAIGRHPELEFVCCEATEYNPQHTFDVIILSDLLNDIWDVQELMALLNTWCAPHTRIIINSYK